MDIRTKLVFALVAVALLSMASLGVFTVVRVQARFEEQTDERLNGLAALKQEALGQVLRGWKDRVALVASRTQLRFYLEEHERTGERTSAASVERSLRDAVRSAPAFIELWLQDADGAVVARALRDDEARPIDTALLDREGTGPGVRFLGVSFPTDGLPVVAFAVPITVEDRVLGTLHAILATDEIEELSDNYEGLGDTGETIVVARDDAGRLRTMHPLRFPPEGASGAGMVLDTDRAAAQSLAEGEVRLSRALTDYRGETVYISTRHIDETDWGLVVKFDEAEQRLPMLDFRQDMTQLAVTLAAFAILFGTFLGIRFAQPIHVLAETAGKIADGDLDARSGIRQEDEVGFLARTFDQMADSLEEQVELLTEFRRFFDVSIDMLCIASTDGYFKRVNRACVRELGWSEEELLSKPFIKFVHPDDHRATAAEIQKLAAGQPTIRFTNRFLCANGSYKRVRWNVYPEPETGRLYAIARVYLDQPDPASASAPSPGRIGEGSNDAPDRSGGLRTGTEAS